MQSHFITMLIQFQYILCNMHNIDIRVSRGKCTNSFSNHYMFITLRLRLHKVLQHFYKIFLKVSRIFPKRNILNHAFMDNKKKKTVVHNLASDILITCRLIDQYFGLFPPFELHVQLTCDRWTQDIRQIWSLSWTLVLRYYSSTIELARVRSRYFQGEMRWRKCRSWNMDTLFHNFETLNEENIRVVVEFRNKSEGMKYTKLWWI